MKQEYICKLDSCNEEFEPVRSDQEFCSDPCRNKYHNLRKNKIKGNRHIFIDRYILDCDLCEEFFKIFGETSFKFRLIGKRGFSYGDYGESVIRNGESFFALGRFAYRLTGLKSIQIIELSERDEIFQTNTKQDTFKSFLGLIESINSDEN